MSIDIDHVHLFVLVGHRFYVSTRGVRSNGFDPRGHVVTGGRGRNFLRLLGVDGVRVSTPRGRSEAGEAVNKNMRGSGGRG